jgi:hypothetical protein
VLHDHSVATSVQALEDCHQVVHGQVQACFDEELLELLVVDESSLLPVNQIEQVLRLMLPELSTDLQDAQLAPQTQLEDVQN